MVPMSASVARGFISVYKQPAWLGKNTRRTTYARTGRWTGVAEPLPNEQAGRATTFYARLPCRLPRQRTRDIMVWWLFAGLSSSGTGRNCRGVTFL